MDILMTLMSIGLGGLIALIGNLLLAQRQMTTSASLSLAKAEEILKQVQASHNQLAETQKRLDEKMLDLYSRVNSYDVSQRSTSPGSRAGR